MGGLNEKLEDSLLYHFYYKYVCKSCLSLYSYNLTPCLITTGIIIKTLPVCTERGGESPMEVAKILKIVLTLICAIFEILIIIL